MIDIDDLKLEYQVIGSFINDTATHDLIESLKEDDFLDGLCRKLFKGLESLRNSNREFSLFKLNEITQISISEIAKLTATIATTATIESDIKQLRDKANRRKLIIKASLISQMAKDYTKEIGEIINNALKEIDELDEIVDEEVITLRQAMLETTLSLDDRFKNKDDRSYYTGINKLDDNTAGLHKEELTTIGARPGVGKTILGMQIALNIAMKKKKVMFTSLEMSVTQICGRILSANTDIDSLRLRIGDIREHEWKQAHDTAAAYAIDDFLLDKTSRTIQHIRAKLRKYKPELVVIDYLQLLQSTTKEFSREREVATMTRDLKLMSLEFKIPIIILSQLNRNAEGKRPCMGDLRESGAIEQDSDNIIFLHEPIDAELDELIRNDIYSYDFFENLKKNNYKLSQLIIEKQRNGPTGTIDLIKVPKLMKFIPISNTNNII